MAEREIVTCDCGGTFFWAVTKAERPMPVDAEPNPDGILELIDRGAGHAPLARVLGEPSLMDPVERWTSHFATCSQAEKFRRRVGAGKGRREHA